MVDDEVVEQEILDEHISYRLSLTYGVRPGFDVGVTTEYLDRRSNVVLAHRMKRTVHFGSCLIITATLRELPK